VGNHPESKCIPETNCNLDSDSKTHIYLGRTVSHNKKGSYSLNFGKKSEIICVCIATGMLREGNERPGYI
jgi:hypothetical protein